MSSFSHPPTKLTVLISGSGTNLQALIDATTSSPPNLPNTIITHVISNKKNAYGLDRARAAGIKTSYHNLVAGHYLKSGERDPEAIKTGRERYDADLAALILGDGPDLIVCAGWMHILSPPFLAPLEKEHVPVINLHPALPGAYDGANAIKRAYEDFVAGKSKGPTGVMVHYVVAEVDRGQPILVREVEFQEGETLEGLEERIHKVEHGIIVEGTRKASEELWEGREKKGGK
ncbi:phosphoribosylglycinamide formyltransferase [Pseudogymnoascus sp. 03VT05]|nr:phosphoribosylglycinamide formyltransferase [Pseudogymnoascus sp. 03VT05]